jgi:hypothetical protein
MKPVPAGISRPMITFSLSPRSLSTLPAIAASVSTRVVSWNEAAEMKLSVDSEARVMPSRIGRLVAGRPPDSITLRFSSSKRKRSTCSATMNSESPTSSTMTLRSICRTMISMCLSLIFTPWSA